MKKSIIRSHLLAAAVSITAALILALFSALLLSREQVRSNLRLLSLMAGSSTPREEGELDTYVSGFYRDVSSTGEDLRLTVLDVRGTVLAQSEPQAAAPGTDLSGLREVEQALVQEFGYASRKDPLTGRRFEYCARLVDGRILLVAARNNAGAYFPPLILIFLLALAVSLYAAKRIGERSVEVLIKPVEKLTRTARAITEGDFDRRVPEQDDELGELASAFNMMTDRLAEANHRLQDQNIQLEGIIQGMDDGVIATYADGTVLLLTERTKELLGPFDDRFSSLETGGVNYARLAKLVRQNLDGDEPRHETFEISWPQERILSVYTAPFADSEDLGVVLVISDITRVNKLEQMRADFVANVTHELKTPLTSIRGYLDLLQSSDRDPETRQQFYDIIEIESERLMSLIGDILELSEIESRQQEQRVNGAGSCLLADVVDEVLEELAPTADKKEVLIHINLPFDLEVPFEHRRMKQLIGNLMVNAVNYNNQGGEVWFEAGIERDRIYIYVRDNGIGIPEEAQARIFERFYRVQKDRSRAMGGTGLGLSIVKHVVGLYGGSVMLDSEVGRGTLFSVYLPLARPGQQISSWSGVSE